ncbi:unnamed protein product [Schistosoma curassoni]|uniref:Uncharacterized protein n=1 Tax=Schistosoma curassoni TaxID=6186 RepID=A0A183JCX4_9TREM|nr:unnamed protein product [Schistosoma curassoni]
MVSSQITKLRITGNPGPGFVLLGTRQQGVPLILRELVLPGGFDLVSPSFTVKDVTTELSKPHQDTNPTSQSNKLCEESIMEFQKYSTTNSDNTEKKQLNLRLRRGHTTLLSLMGSELSDISKSDKSETAEDSYNDFTTISLPYDQANESTNALINEYIPDVLPLTTANLSKYIVKQEIIYWNHVLSQQISMELMNKLNDDKNVVRV